MRVADYARVHYKWYRDEVLDVITDEQPDAAFLFIILLSLAKEESHYETNPQGLIRRTILQISRVLKKDEQTIKECLQLLADGELIVITDAGKMGIKSIEVVNFTKWNAPRGSQRERNQKHYEKQTFAGEKPPIKTPLRQESDTLKTKTRLDNTRQDNTTSSSKESETQQIRKTVDDIHDIITDFMNVNKTHFKQNLELKIRGSGHKHENWIAAVRALERRYENNNPLDNENSVIMYLCKATAGIETNKQNMRATGRDKTNENASFVRDRLNKAKQS